MKDRLDFAAIDTAGKSDAIGDAKLLRQLLQIGEKRPLADNRGLRIDAAHCAHKHIKALVANESANRRDMTRVSLPDLLNTHALCRAKRAPIAKIYPVREDHAFGSVWSEDIRAIDHRLSRNDDFVGAGQHTAGEWTDDSPERGVTQHVCVPIDDESDAGRQAQHDGRVSQRKWRMMNDNVCRACASPECWNVEGRDRRRKQIA